MKSLTHRQQEVLTFLQHYVDENGIPPTHSEIAKALECRSNTAASDHLKALERKGYIKLYSEISRGIQLLTNPFQLPLIGKVAAGMPIEAVENVESYLALPETLFQQEADYLLRVCGDSMRDAGILNDDLIAVKKSQVAENGQIVVARLDQEVTVKRLKIQGKNISLVPENPAYPVIGVHPDYLVIEGIYVGLIRERGY